ncbi:hypothetical protein L249_2066 [Ophiocordyceps polyrhachis-furcata BCC 54312]|uniref:Impact N-terminal domain-containing protein n=1 Tax=Ophiocordyceps polyrhachis-furcata BCC 54312 TaxID=1330021 RepID=A0A367LR94_9HYPO|nr:hypothetical protein L249_2066 [Ophiocordyceps polyrhachis-furcata BCC 54312]
MTIRGSLEEAKYMTTTTTTMTTTTKTTDELADEVSAINSIYGPGTLTATETEGEYTIKLATSTLRLRFPPRYPFANEAPSVLGCVSVVGARGDGAAEATRRLRDASHNIVAWRVRGDGQVAFSDCDDDGEAAAGGRLLRLLQLCDAWDVVVVVSRWFGGVRLGPRRFALINTVAREALVRGGWVAS